MFRHWTVVSRYRDFGTMNIVDRIHHLEKPLIIIAVLLINMVASSVVSYSAEGQFVCACFSEGTVNEENRWYTPPKCKEEMKQMAIFARNLPGITVFFFSFCAL